MDRREFLKHLGLAGVGAVAAHHGLAADGKPAGQLPRRAYGETGIELSIVGLGGIAVMKVEQQQANETVAWAVDRGVNYFDVAPSYGDAQDRLGPALKSYRERAFLACKTGKRDAAGALAELENSLRVLQTDHLDLYQHHGFTKPEEVEQVFAAGGAMETFIKAREQGKVRFLGFSAHDEATAVMALERFKFDSVLFPFNAGLMEHGFGARIMAAAKERGAARLALKALAWTKVKQGGPRRYANCWYQPQDDPQIADLLLRYTLSLPVTAAVPPGDASLSRLCVEIASRYEALTEAERAELKKQMAGLEPIFECHG